MEDWKENKKRFYYFFPNGELIYQSKTPITVSVSESDKEAELENLKDSIYWYFNLKDLGDFVDAVKDDFYSNTLTSDYRYNDIIIPKGMKIIKAFKYFVDDKEVLTKIQDKASLLIQNTKLTGYLCMSVHPLDYLSSSENNHKWRSCHALDGEYRSGNLSYMTDSCTIVCYLKSEHETILPHFPGSVYWNDKKWRMLLYVSNDNRLLISGRHYPYECLSLQDIILEWFCSIFGSSYNYTPWCKNKFNRFEIGDKIYYSHGRLLPIGDKMIDDTKVIVEPKVSIHYNDPLHSTVYDYYFSEVYREPYWYTEYDEPREKLLNLAAIPDKTQVEIGHDVKCCVCGKEDCVLSETMLCIDCELLYGTEETDNFTHCRDCGCRIYIPEAILIDDYEDDYVCKDCGEKY